MCSSCTLTHTNLEQSSDTNCWTECTCVSYDTEEVPRYFPMADKFVTIDEYKQRLLNEPRQVSSSVSYLLITCNNPRSLSLFVPYKLNKIPKHFLPLKSSSTQLSLLDRLSPCLRYFKNSIFRSRPWSLFSTHSLRSRSSTISTLAVYLYPHILLGYNFLIVLISLPF